MRDRPILFSAPMVRAILAGTKTQTRRFIPHQWWRCLDADDQGDRARAVLKCPHGMAGDSLWGKEAIRHAGGGLSVYAADCAATKADAWPWTRESLPAMFCPRGLSRIRLELTGVRIERVQDISRQDAIDEGVERHDDDGVTYYGPVNHGHVDPVVAYRWLWDSLNGGRAGGSWVHNPTVWVLSFRTVES